MKVPCTSKEEFARCFMRECRPEMMPQRRNKKRNGQGMPEEKRQRKKRQEQKVETIRRLYLYEGKTAAEVAQEMGMTTVAVRKTLQKHKINRKGREK